MNTYIVTFILESNKSIDFKIKAGGILEAHNNATIILLANTFGQQGLDMEIRNIIGCKIFKLESI